MAASRLDGTNGTPMVTDFIDYGCAGRNYFDAFSKTLGRQVDNVDKLFYKWKKCIQCATNEDEGMILAYQFNPYTESCGEFANLFYHSISNTPSETSTDESRPICECDRQLVDALAIETVNADHINYDGTLCVKNSLPSPHRGLHCCNFNTFMFANYNPDKSCCHSADGVKPFGTC